MTGGLFNVPRLEQALLLWEDHAFLFHVFDAIAADGFAVLAKSYENKLLEYPESFRRELLAAAEKEFDASKFTFPSLKRSQEGLIAQGMEMVAGAIHGWSAHSRNVFHLTDELRVLLQASSFKHVKWGEVPWPFKSFAITLEKPVPVQNELIDTIVFNTGAVIPGEKVKVFSFLFLPSTLDGYEGMKDGWRRRHLLEFRRGNIMEVGRRVAKLRIECVEKKRYPLFGLMSAESNVGFGLAHNFAQTTVGGTSPDYGVGIEEMMRLVPALALYLSSLPPGSPSRNQAKLKAVPPPIKRNDPRLISLPANVCRVTSTHTLTPEEKDEMEEAMARERTGQVQPHWRRGHFRRPPGFGRDPTIPRSIWVRPVLVNRRHLPDGVLPGGSIVKVLPPATAANDDEIW